MIHDQYSSTHCKTINIVALIVKMAFSSFTITLLVVMSYFHANIEETSAAAVSIEKCELHLLHCNCMHRVVPL